ncbi:MAG: 4Fe-4S dicluster domain-containing protein [Anaerolineales bacterium]|nr:4Fe-4S dicluster domain-containing protein [Anaerolineales bacterium]MDW8160923.1 4Fe-4S dicluster domain-containing protein [Anaerolineales bacterium]
MDERVLTVETHGDPLGTIRRILKTIWKNAQLDALLVPTNGSGEIKAKPLLLHSPEELDSFNPFRPVMTSNAARFLPELQTREVSKALGAVLRPCEMRALKGLEKNSRLSTAGLLTISFDCLGTYPLEDYHWRAAQKGPDQLTLEAIQFARQGGIVPYRFRSACQVCQSPASGEAQFNIGVIGLPIRQYLLLTLSHKELEKLISGSDLGLREATQDSITAHRMMVAKVIERNHRVNERIRQGMADIFPMSVEQLVDSFSQCGECQKCMSICPLCAIDKPTRSEDGKYPLEEVVRWVESCAGCGMCDQVCPLHRPLSAFFSFVRNRLHQELTPALSSSGSALLH